MVDWLLFMIYGFINDKNTKTKKLFMSPNANWRAFWALLHNLIFNWKIVTCFIENDSSDCLIKIFFTLCLHFTNWLVLSELKHCALSKHLNSCNKEKQINVKTHASEIIVLIFRGWFRIQRESKNLQKVFQW